MHRNESSQRSVRDEAEAHLSYIIPRNSSLLHVAAINGDLEGVKQLCADLPCNSDVDVNKKDRDDATPLHLAVQEGHVEIVKVLLSVKGIDANAQNGVGKTAFDIAFENSNKEIIKLLWKVTDIDK